MEEAQLIRSCQNGDSHAFQVIVNAYKGKVMAIAYNILRNKQDAEDAAQEAFIKAYKNLDRFDIQKSFKDWLYSILYNQCMDFLRKRRRFFNLFNKAKGEYRDTVFNNHKTAIDKSSISRRWLERLNSRERIALSLWANEGYTSDEIAEVMRCSSSTARVHLFKARRKIKALLEEENAANTMQNQ